MNNATAIILGIPMLCLLVVLGLLVVSASQAVIVNTHKNAAWPKFATQVGAKFQAATGAQPDLVSGRIGALPFYLDTYITGGKKSLKHYTRLRVFYPPRIPLEFCLYSEDLRDEASPDASLSAVDTAGLGLDTGLLAYTNDPNLMRRVLLTDQLTRMLKTIKKLDMQVRRRRNWKEGGVSSAVYEVHLQVEGVVTDVATLVRMLGILEATLRQLQLVGVAGTSFAEVVSQISTL